MLIILIWTLIFSFLPVSEAGDGQRRILKALFNNSDYSIYDRPVANETETLKVKIEFYLMQLVDLNEKDGFLKASIWIKQDWKAYNLRWKPQEFDGMKNIRVDVRNIWRPDILLFNSADEKFDGTWPVNAVLEYTGDVTYTPPAMIKCSCSIDIRWFPFDQQKCTLVYGSWTYSAYYLDLNVSKSVADISKYISIHLSLSTSTYTHPYDSSDWLLVSALSYRDWYTFDQAPYAQVKLEITVQRRSLYYYFNLILPCSIISLMTLLVFALAADSKKKMTLSVTIILSLGVFMMTISDKLPRSSESVSQIGLYLNIMMIVCATSVMLSVWVLSIHFHPDLTSDPPYWIRYGVCIYMATFLFMEIPEHIKKKAEFLRKQQRALRHLQDAVTSESLIANVLDINDDLITSSGLVSSKSGEKNKIEGNNATATGVEKQSDRNGSTFSSPQFNKPNAQKENGGLSNEFAKVPSPPPPTGFRDNDSETITYESATKSATTQRRPLFRIESAAQGVGAANLSLSRDLVDAGTVAASSRKQRASTERTCQHYRAQISYVLHELKCLANKVYGDGKKDAIKSEWVFAARVIDRLFLYIYAVLIVAFTLPILLSPPDHWKSLYPPEVPLI